MAEKTREQEISGKEEGLLIGQDDVQIKLLTFDPNLSSGTRPQQISSTYNNIKIAIWTNE
ncbi:conserved hypothetical protein [Ricinus communis]|uniref:Uncharacterized protein n=1 Tax=Ricinus communis TaxID=3988 RepID=B9S4W5_RICCO|nr:conserved hypothetical protein [Ricinus communis]